MLDLYLIVLLHLFSVGISFTVEFYLRPNGRINLRLNDFTFYKHLKARTNAHRWSCTAYGSKWKCKAHLVITDKLEVLKANVTHSHPPSKKKPTSKKSDEIRKLEFMKQVQLQKIAKPKKEKKEKQPIIRVKNFGNPEMQINPMDNPEYDDLSFGVEPPMSSLQDYLVAHSVFADY
ncbi:uncharacterized protein LOC134748723 [Cydia strobilella]|uniref:uncharacterized protein LOC134748723 n=1 Tax=Cydia strobilella TaxID=1100964 RepID=UPI00300621B6